MNNDAKLKAFAQSVILTMTGKHMDTEDLNGADGTQFILELIDWTNQFLDEVELETDWNYVRELQASIGTVSSLTQTFELSDDIRKLSVNEHRPLHILQDGTAVSTWDVVNPNMIMGNRDAYPLRERVTYISGNLVFSRNLTESEMGGEVVADVINKIPLLSLTNTDVLDLVKPKQLLIFGVAKNATLPNFVRGGISPSLVQKYADILEKAVMENNASSMNDTVERDDFGHISGVGY